MPGNPGDFRAELMLRGFCAKMGAERKSASKRRWPFGVLVLSSGLGIRGEDVVEVVLELVGEELRQRAVTSRWWKTEEVNQPGLPIF